ncbi:GL23885 [Drosophila persimilis]|uniref:GL23885 n=1 Tax=Drosophila persimilis TaxID=7234 RepID=B4G2C2_DROPE|nr:GL23885 [Drosophila persimilis]
MSVPVRYSAAAEYAAAVDSGLGEYSTTRRAIPIPTTATARPPAAATYQPLRAGVPIPIPVPTGAGYRVLLPVGGG